MRDTSRTYEADVVLGEDWESPQSADFAMRENRARRGFLTLNRSPLARKIITFNLLGLLLLVAGVFYLNPFRDSLALQREAGLQAEAQLIADVFEVQLGGDPVALDASGVDIQAVVDGLDLSSGVEVFVFGSEDTILGSTIGSKSASAVTQAQKERRTVITDFLNAIWEGMSSIFSSQHTDVPDVDAEGLARAMVDDAATGRTTVRTGSNAAGGTIFSVATPVIAGNQVVGVVAITSAQGEIDTLVRSEREQVLQMFVIAILVSIGLSLLLASTIANPIADLASAAEIGRENGGHKMSPTRVRIPDLTGRPDEIGRLSGALRGMVAALYDRIDANEQFAADVSHEIKNPLASLRSAVSSLRVAKRDDQRSKLLDVIEHDVRRLDRLVSDISNASRLDSELVKEEEESFDLLHMLCNLTEYLGGEAQRKGVEFITDVPKQPIRITGLEARLAQVFVNLITNALSFCEEGDAVRVWVRRRENRVLVVVEDTGPGIPEQALTKVFNRFYSERPEGQFGDHSGLGLAISKQIVEAHGGVIWAENIRPTEDDITSEPLGARFVVGLPV